MVKILRILQTEPAIPYPTLWTHMQLNSSNYCHARTNRHFQSSEKNHALLQLNLKCGEQASFPPITTRYQSPPCPSEKAHHISKRSWLNVQPPPLACPSIPYRSMLIHTHLPRFNFSRRLHTTPSLELKRKREVQGSSGEKRAQRLKSYQKKGHRV